MINCYGKVLKYTNNLPQANNIVDNIQNHCKHQGPIYIVYRSLLAPAADTGFPDMNYEELSRDGMKCQNKYLFESQKKLDVQLL